MQDGGVGGLRDSPQKLQGARAEVWPWRFAAHCGTARFCSWPAHGVTKQTLKQLEISIYGHTKAVANIESNQRWGLQAPTAGCFAAPRDAPCCQQGDTATCARDTGTCTHPAGQGPANPLREQPCSSSMPWWSLMRRKRCRMHEAAPHPQAPMCCTRSLPHQSPPRARSSCAGEPFTGVVVYASLDGTRSVKTKAISTGELRYRIPSPDARQCACPCSTGTRPPKPQV